MISSGAYKVQRLILFCFTILLLLAGGCSSDDESVHSGSEVAAPLILVTGVTGQQGGAVLRELLSRGYRVRGLTRDRSSAAARTAGDLGAEIAEGDFGDRNSLERAMEGVYGVFMVLPFLPTRELEWGRNLADAALASSVGHLVFSSSGTADRELGIPESPKMRVQNYIRDLGLSYTFLLPASFMENWDGLEHQVATYGIRDPRSADKRSPHIAVRDIAFFVGEAFDNPDGWAGRELNIAGDDFTLAEMTSIFSDVMGRPIEYVQVPWEEWIASQDVAIIELYRWYDSVGYQADVPALRALYPGLLTLEEYLRETGWEDW